MRKLMLIILALACSPVLTLAVNQTPSSKKAFATEPYMFGLGSGRGAFTVSCLDQGYTLTEHYEAEGDGMNDAGVMEWIAGLAGGYGTFLIVSHGSANGPAVEAYMTSDQRDLAWNFLEGHGFDMGELIKSSSIHGYSISMRSSGITAHFVAANTIVHNFTCSGHLYQTAWSGARVRMGYNSDTDPLIALQDLIAIWPRLAGTDAAKRNVDTATDGTNISVDGSDDTTLTPFVNNVSVDSGTQIPEGGKEITIEFDTETNQGSSPLAVSGPFTLTNVQWESSTKVKGTVTPNGDGEGYFTAQASNIASSNCAELLLNGGNDYDLRIRHEDNPAAAVCGFSYSDGQVQWKTVDLYQTDHFRVETATSVEGPWATVVDDIPAVLGHSSVPLSGNGLLRLVEVEQDSTELIHGIASTEDRRSDVRTATASLTVPEMQQKIDELNQRRQSEGYGGQLPLSSNTLTIYTTPQFESAVWSNFGHFWQDYWGLTVQVVTTDAYPQTPDGIRNGIKNDIAARYNTGERAFLLVGDANDHVQFTGSQYPSLWLPPNGWETIRQAYLADGYQDQASHDLIPTFYIPDTLPRNENQGWVTPYFMSDLPYGNVDSDPQIEALVTRLPFTNEADIYGYGYKLQSYHNGYYGPQSAAFYVGNVDHNGCSGAEALAIANAVDDYVPGGTYIDRVLESSYPSAAVRNTVVADHFNSTRPEVVFLSSSISNRSWPANFFDQTNGTNPWSMDMISSSGTHEALVVAGACDGGDFPRTEDAEFGTPIGHKFVAAWCKGAIAWVGPTAGTWQTGNRAFSIYFAQEIFGNPGRSMGESYLVAINRVLVDYADQPEVVNTVMSYAFIGDPIVPLNRAMYACDVPEPSPKLRLELGQNAPNPFDQQTGFAFQLQQKGQASLKVYDVSGRQVTVLLDGIQTAGQYRLTWDGRNDQGQAIPNGIYFYRLTTSDQQLDRKLMVVH